MGKAPGKTLTSGVAKVPVIMQLEALECGAACLAMILAYYQKWIPLETVRKDCGVSRDGSNAKNILKAARNYGLEANGYRFEVESIRSDGSYPCIIHWNFNHFVVLNGFRGKNAVINDPARGTVKISMEEFDKSFTGIALCFEPGPEFVPEGKPASTWDYIKTRLSDIRTAVFLVVLTTIITSMIDLIQPAFSRIFIDYLLKGMNKTWIRPFLLFLALFSMLQIAVSWVQTLFSLRINGKLDAVGTTSYMWKVLKLPMDFFSQRMAGDIQSRMSSNASIASSIVQTLAPLVLNTMMMVVYLVILLRFSVMLTLIGIISMAINLILARIISNQRINLMRVSMRDQGKLSGTTTSGIEMIETIKATGAENGFFQRWSGYQAAVNSANVAFSNLNNYLGMIPSLVRSILNTVITMLGVYLIIKGRFTEGTLIAFQGYLSRFESPAESLISAGQTFQEMRTEIERVEDVMNSQNDPAFDCEEKETTESSLKKLTGAVEMSHVTFGYSPLAEPLIRDFSLSLAPGARVALVGTSGCGKSTIAKLISGLYQPWEGSVTFDGKTQQQIDRSVFTGSLAVVDQDIILFEDTIANNIRMWDNSIEDFEMILAAKDAAIHDDIMRRPEGYQHVLIEGGNDFSGGQRQRIEIARVLAQDPRIIILDEATSALDAKAEYDVVNAIKDRGITCIVIAHRLSTIRDSDEIIVLEHSNVVERGTHEELYKNDGLYKELVTNA
ncbi:MAG: NHLP family bacteriocin export ABC transporter peptidase/permease/ATPase subunit [Solobacterium sp.]|nr:NHLP family bacteriocin export ABC transporter peptidase/permease/ATPase subunit [Solobacterium sp.]